MRRFLPILRRNQHRLAVKNHEALYSSSVNLNASASITKTILSSAKHQNLFIKSTAKLSNRLNTAHKFTVAEIIIGFNSKDVAFSIQKVLKNHQSAAISLALSIATKGEIQFMPSPLASDPDELRRMWLLVQLAKPLILFEEGMPKILKLLDQVELNSNFWVNSFSFQLAIKHVLSFSKLNAVEYQAFSTEIFSILSNYPQNRVAAELTKIVNDFKVTALNHGTIGDNQARIQEFVPFLKNLINNECFVTEHCKVDQSIQFLLSVEKETVSIISMVRKLLNLGYIPSGKTIEALVARYVNEKIPNCYSFCRELYSYISKDNLSDNLFILLIRSIQTCTETSNSGHLGIEEIEKEILRNGFTVNQEIEEEIIISYFSTGGYEQALFRFMEHRRYFDVSAKLYDSIFKTAWKSKAAAQFIVNDLQHSMKRDGIPHTSSTLLSLLKCCEVTNNIMELVRICELELRTDQTTRLFNDYYHEAKLLVENLAERCDDYTKDIILKFFDD